mmetsp:Transcript_34623/g.82717  ORF Transcript_34623/g.82717 Transcript_34623/m.82717 type:complete len:183 (+) Transcript_34623:149-697(+)
MTRIATGTVWFFLAFLGVVSSFTPPINSIARPQRARRTVAVGVVEEKTKPAAADAGYLDSLSAESSAPAEAAVEEEEELTETQKLLKKVKEAGTAGAISYALWELGFWGLSLPVCIFGYQQATGHWPDFGDVEDQKKIAAEAFAFVNFARLAVPLRIGLALSTTPWIDENVVQKFGKKDEEP